MTAPDYAPPAAPADGRQSQAALDIARGTSRMLSQHAMAALSEVALANGRRADLVAIGRKGEIWIVEVKSSVSDFRADQKWPEYREFCDRLLFAVAPGFPVELLPEDTGLIVADRYGGELVRPAPEHALPAQRRKALLLELARLGAARLMWAADPDLEAFARGGG
jgi:hypothetical protein